MKGHLLIASWLILASAIVGCSSESRRFCEVRFGTPESQSLVLSLGADALLVYRDGDMKSEPDVYPLEDGNLPDGTVIPIVGMNDTSYRITSLSQYCAEGPPARTGLILYVVVDADDSSFKQYCDVELTRDVRSMKYAHFDGPMTVDIQQINWQVPVNVKLVIGGDPTDIRAYAGTIDEAEECWTVIETGEGQFPEGVHPYVTVEFPTNDDIPLVEKYPLDEFC